MTKLIKCKTCEKEISRTAKSCPHCGELSQINWNPELKKKHIIIICVGIILFCIMVVTCIVNMPEEDPNAWKTEDNKIMAYIMIEDFVKQRLKSPGTAEFPGVLDGKIDHVTALGNQTYRIISYVDAQNSFGAMIRTKFIGEIKQTSDVRWQLISLNLK